MGTRSYPVRLFPSSEIVSKAWAPSLHSGRNLAEPMLGLAVRLLQWRVDRTACEWRRCAVAGPLGTLPAPVPRLWPNKRSGGRRVREDGLCFESEIEPLYYSQVCAMKSQFRMRLWELQLKTTADTRWFKNWMYVLVVIMVQFRVVNSSIKRGKYCTVAQFACRVKELCSKNFTVVFLNKTSVVRISIGGGSGLSF
jgi:hypothetical protein